MIKNESYYFAAKKVTDVTYLVGLLKNKQCNCMHTESWDASDSGRIHFKLIAIKSPSRS